MKTLFFGTSAFAVPSLRAFAACTQLEAVVTQPDRPAGRGHKLRPTPVKEAARELGIAVLEPASLREFARSIAHGSFDLFALASYGRILPGDLLRVPRLGALNVHPSLLPRYRGATPLQSALRDGASETGVTIMLMDTGMDTGDVVLQERVPIRSDETYGELHDRLAELGARLLVRAVELARASALAHAPQHGDPSLTRPIGKADLQIDWQWDAQRIVNTVRAFSPQPAARAALGGIPVKILRAHALAEPSTAAPGTVFGPRGHALAVACAGGAVALDEIVPPNRGPLSGAAFAQYLAAQR